MSWPKFTEEEIEITAEILRSGKVNYWTGEHGKAFEQEFAKHCGVEHAVACMNGTVALEMALQALEIGAGDEVVVTPRSFMASVSCVPWAGAVPVFADVDRESGNLSAETIEAVITERTRAVILVHIGGWPCEMDEILELARRKNLFVIEDCAQAHGATYKGKPVGSMGDIGVYSFCQDKIISTGGEGGMLVTNNRDFWKRAWSWKDHGKDYDTVFHTQHPAGFRWLHESFGTNGRMPEVQSAIGRIQLRNLKSTQQGRRKIAEIWHGVTKQPSLLRSPWPASHLESAFYRYITYLNEDQLADGWSRLRIIEEANKRGVRCMEGSCGEIYREKAFDETGWRPASPLPTARELGITSITFLTHPTQELDEVQVSAKAFEELLGEASTEGL